MQLESTFSVVAPINDVWETLMDFERVAGCVPGAQVLNKLSEDAYQVGLKVMLGPVSMQYRGQLIVRERDATAHRAVFEGKAQEARGQGTAQGTATLVLVESAGTTTGTVSADVDLSGKVAAMGKSVIGGVTDQMMGLFAENLQNLVGESREDRAEGTSEGTPAAPSTVRSPSAQPSRAAAVKTESAETGLNAVALVTGMIMDWLTPAKLLGFFAGVAYVAYRVGRRAESRTVSR
ncbi:SRPBCC family protein [Cryobacterium sp. 1639]|uniref:SRPBCC family protein n=1 Tax=Cryobacterium inferilacus TaxID=2866629 RepID=UPI001C73B44A|nr:SRPBCC family protein [Cryobacterium sp. 1639]MBX0300446.1 SRPBCC family protein [Cryobacterium sp. 1639]